jgi:16S rRNA (cytosine1402-N4)-methyltransferase
MEIAPFGHESVLLSECIAALSIASGKTIIDCTTGRGGHSEAIARALGPDGTLICLDVDPRNLEFARDRLKSHPCQIRFFHANFAELSEVLEAAKIETVDGILADLGLSTNQFLDPSYGISFSMDGPLDMRLDPRITETAADIVNRYREEDLANLLYQLADERFSRRIARKIADARRTSPIKTTEQLASLVRVAIGRSGASEKIDPATRTFMALRMKVNREVENLERLMDEIPKALKRGGRAAIISFHSVEDRMVKRAFRFAEQTGLIKVVTKKPITPTDSETASNPRSRSAKLRIAEKL